MTANRKLKGCLFRTMLAFVALVALAFFYLRFFSGRVEQFEWNGRRDVAAEVRFYDSGFATESPDTAVQLRTKFSPIRHTVFFAVNHGGVVRISWVDSQTLLIACEKPKSLAIYKKLSDWDGIRIVYAYKN
jgi:hypothetical protein